MAMTRNALLRSSLVGGRVGGVVDEVGLFVRRVGEMLKTKKIVWVGKERSGRGVGGG
jgi:hypothetical protein